jgi:hypothetical protein
MQNAPSRMVWLGAVAAISLTATAARADDKAASCPMHEQHMKQAEESHADAVKRRGDKGMGFSQDRTVHHFRLLPDGGSIEVAVADAADAESKEQIQHHLAHIAGAFSSGDFALPMLIHAQTPPGVPTMRRLKARISYSYEGTPAGGRVRIATKDAQAVAAVHAFLRFQISDHQTGDPTTVQPQ